MNEAPFTCLAGTRKKLMAFCLFFLCLHLQLKFMWGNLTLVSSDRKDVLVPSLLPGQEGVVSVEFVAPPMEGTYTSHWRLSHRGEQFGPRIWCSIVVDPSCNTDCPENSKLVSSFSQKGSSHCKKEVRPLFYIPEPV